MDLLETRAIASLYRVTPRGACSKILTGLTVGNGIGWSSDNKKMYLTDSGIGTLFRFDFDPITGTISNRVIFAKVPREHGIPDGLTVDCEGGIWSAHFDGGKLTRYRASGEVDFVMDLPVKSPTSLCFGGPNLSDLYVTSSMLGDSDCREHDGSVLRIPTKFWGIQSNRFNDAIDS